MGAGTGGGQVRAELKQVETQVAQEVLAWQAEAKEELQSLQQRTELVSSSHRLPNTRSLWWQNALESATSQRQTASFEQCLPD